MVPESAQESGKGSVVGGSLSGMHAGVPLDPGQRGSHSAGLPICGSKEPGHAAVPALLQEARERSSPGGWSSQPEAAFCGPGQSACGA